MALLSLMKEQFEATYTRLKNKYDIRDGKFGGKKGNIVYWSKLRENNSLGDKTFAQLNNSETPKVA